MKDNLTYPAITLCFKNWENQGYDKQIMNVSCELSIQAKFALALIFLLQSSTMLATTG